MNNWACLLYLSLFALTACDERRVYEQNIDLDDAGWAATNRLAFDFTIDNPEKSYNIYYLVRNSPDFPFSRIFVVYDLAYATGSNLEKGRQHNYLFDQKTGQPYGKNGIGSIFSHQFPLLTHYRFSQAGRYTLQLEQFNRTDMLQGVLSVGIRVEYAE